MISLLEAKGYRCLRYASQDLGPFQVLVGPNASGKTTFLDVISFLGRLVSDGPEAACEERTRNFQDLTWQRKEEGFELAVEALVPKERKELLGENDCSHVRYEVRLMVDESGGIAISDERVFLLKNESRNHHQRSLFPEPPLPPDTILTHKGRKHARTVISKVPGGNDNFYSEVSVQSGKGWVPSYRLGQKKSALGNLPDDETKFPVSTWLREFLIEGVQQISLNSLKLRRASPPGRGRAFRPDGSNLPWVIAMLEKDAPDLLAAWIAHVQTALPDLAGIRTIERGDDHHRYLVLQYTDGLKVPSWTASDGTLALTLMAYLPGFRGAFLIEEPENGIHPRAVQTVFQSLVSAYETQILVATHSPVVLGMAEPRHVLCFAKNAEGATDIVTGEMHPSLRSWTGDPNLGVLFAGGVLG